jgi:hypothetical protein
MGVLVLLAAPAALGPAVASVMRELGARQTHLCKCGMPRGECGCPECARAPREPSRGRLPDDVPAMRSHCEDDAPAFASVPIGVAAASPTRLPAPSLLWPVISAPFFPGSPPGDAPPTPPPRPIAA